MNALAKIYDSCEMGIRYGVGTTDVGDGEQGVICLEYANPECDHALISLLRITLMSGCHANSVRNPDNTFTMVLESALRAELACEPETGEHEVLRAPAWSATLDNILPDTHRIFVDAGAEKGWWVLMILAPAVELVAGFRIDGSLVGLTQAIPRQTVGMFKEPS